MERAKHPLSNIYLIPVELTAYETKSFDFAIEVRWSFYALSKADWDNEILGKEKRKKKSDLKNVRRIGRERVSLWKRKIGEREREKEVKDK